MAAEDNIWVGTGEYNNAQKKEAEIKQECIAVNQKVSSANQSLQNFDKEIAAQANINKEKLEALIAENSGKQEEMLLDLKEGIGVQLGIQNVHFKKQLDELQSNVDAVNDQVNQLDEKIKEIVDDFNRKINDILSGIKDRKLRAEAWAQQFSELMEQISVLNPDKLAGDDYIVLLDGLKNIATNQKNGDYEALISVAQTNFSVAAILQTKLELMNNEYNNLIIQINNLIEERDNLIKEMNIPEKNIKEIPVSEAEKIEFDGRIAFWTSGVFESLVERFEQICRDVKDVYEPEMDIDSLKKTLAELTTFINDLNECEKLAHDEFIISDSVVNLVRRIHHILAVENSWSLKESGFKDDDERLSYSLSLENGTDMLATIVVIPERNVESQSGKNIFRDAKFRLDVFDMNGNNEEALCDLTRNGILEDLMNGEIKIGIDVRDNTTIINRARKPQMISTECSEDFISLVSSDGDAIKENRIRDAMHRVGL